VPFDEIFFNISDMKIFPYFEMEKGCHFVFHIMEKTSSGLPLPRGSCKSRFENSRFEMGFCSNDYFVKSYFHFPELHTGRIKLIYDNITEIYRVKNEFNLTCEVQENGNGVLKNSC